MLLLFFMGSLVSRVFVGILFLLFIAHTLQKYFAALYRSLQE